MEDRYLYEFLTEEDAYNFRTLGDKTVPYAVAVINEESEEYTDEEASILFWECKNGFPRERLPKLF